MSEIRIVSFNFPPKGWAFCNGQLMAINQNQALFSLLGTTFGGDGRVTFGLPNFQGRVPMHVGNGHTLGEKGGETAHTLSMGEMPAHTHTFKASVNSTGSTNIPGGNVLANSAPNNLYGPAQNFTQVVPETIGTMGGSLPHSNSQPYVVLNFCIALFGIFPSRN